MRENRPIKGSSDEECRSPADLNLASARKRQMRSPSRGGSQNAFLRALRRGLRACTTHQRHCKPSCRMVAFKLRQGQRECGLFPQMAEDEPRRVPFECKVTVTELDGISHSVEVQADALFRGCVRRITAFRQEGWAAEALTPNARPRVEVHPPPTVHEVSMEASSNGADRRARPKEFAAKRRLDKRGDQ